MFRNAAGILAFVCMTLGVPKAAESQCDSGQTQDGTGWSCDKCSGGNPGQTRNCERTGGTVRSVTSCQNTGWKEILGDPQSFNVFAIGGCEQAPQGADPNCMPAASGPSYWGVESGNLKFTYWVQFNFAAPSGFGCVPGSAFETEHNSIPAAGCCASACQDPSGCQAIGRVYSSGTCTCAEPPDCSGCVNEPPCTVDQVLDPECNCCRTPEEGSPIIVNLESNASIKLSRPEDGILFDILANDRPVRVSWPISEEAYWLALDRNGNGTVDNGSELFGNMTPLVDGTPAPHGYAALAEFDENQDGRIDSADKIYYSLVLWRRPLPSQGVVRADEYIPLEDSGVAAILLDPVESRRRDRFGNEFRYRTRVLLSNDRIRWSYDVFLAYVLSPM